MKKGFYRATYSVISLLENKIETEKSWVEQRGYNLASARMINVLRGLIGEIYTLEDIVQEENKVYKLKVRGE